MIDFSLTTTKEAPMASHSNCTHPATPAARAACRKQRAGAPAPLRAVAPTAAPVLTTPGAHMTPEQCFQIARQMLDDHGFQSWSVRLDNATKRAGGCSYGGRYLTFSRKLMGVRSYDDTRMTIIHELAHALTPGHHHDAVWRAKDIELGGRGTRCFDASEALQQLGKFVATCSACDQKFYRQRRPQAGRTHWCKCQSYLPYQDRAALVWVPNAR
ncbi:SprT-like protease [Gordonia phage Margaret]|nr:SprT-like protease [Gordonia phage Margaret]